MTRYIVTGRLYRSKARFSLRFSSLAWALGINLYYGSVWEEVDGKRRLIKRVGW